MWDVVQACRAKETFRKFVDSVLQRSAKIRSLIADLGKNYPEDQTAKKYRSPNIRLVMVDSVLCVYVLLFVWIAPLPMPVLKPQPSGNSKIHVILHPRSIKALENDLTTLDGEYNALSDMMAKGEQEDFSPECFGKTHVMVLLHHGFHLNNLNLNP